MKEKIQSELIKFLNWVDQKTYYFEDKDVTSKQVVNEYNLNGLESIFREHSADLKSRVEELEKENREMKLRIEAASNFIKEKRATTPGLGAITAILNF
jgi:carbamate kinase